MSRTTKWYRARPVRLFLGVLLGVFAQLAAIGLLLASAWLIVRAAQHPPVLFLMVAIVSVRFFGISRSIFRYLERLFTHDVALGDSIDQRIHTYRQLDRVAPRGLSGTRKGDLVSRVIADVTTLQDRLLRIKIPWWTGLISAAVVAYVLLRIDLVSAIVLASGVVLCALGLRLGVGRLGAARRASSTQSRGDMAAEATELVGAAPDIVAAGGRAQALHRAQAATAQLARIQSDGAVMVGLGSALILAVTGAVIAALAALSAGVDPVMIGVVLLAPVGLAEPLDFWSEAERVRPVVVQAKRRLDALAAIEDAVSTPTDVVALPAGWDLRVEAVSAGWSKVAVSDVSFELPEGDMLAISGPSGVGKSTFAYTLVRLLDPLAGQISLGGVDITRLDPVQLRTRIGYLGQDEAVFNTSVRENLRIADPDASDERMWQALASAGLADFVKGLPRGLDTEVGEHGGLLSGGERQRLCLARVLLGEHKVLVVDEPTEHLDSDAARSLMDDLIALAPERSLVVISHAPAVLARFDAVVEFRVGS